MVTSLFSITGVMENDFFGQTQNKLLSFKYPVNLQHNRYIYS